METIKSNVFAKFESMDNFDHQFQVWISTLVISDYLKINEFVVYLSVLECINTLINKTFSIITSNFLLIFRLT